MNYVAYPPKECKIETTHPAHDWLPSGEVPGPGPGYRRCSGVGTKEVTADLEARRKAERVGFDERHFIGCSERLSPGKGCTCDEPKPYEEVDHPAHYGGDVPYEPIKVMEAWEEMFHLTVNVMMAVKYLVRAGSKPGTPRKKDLKKALWHIQREINRCR